jgi:catechol 2,3-dioxygenase-like lactoylglutathione lyase family enzyme
MADQIQGIHHVTAIAGEANRNIDFYTQVLGLRLVKVTVNFDDPAAYHLYYGDELGRPGTIITFFVWPDWIPGRPGAGHVTAVAFSVPPGSFPYWQERFGSHAVRFEPPAERFDETVLTFYDPDGLRLELVAGPDADTREPWARGPVPAEHAIRGIHSVTLTEGVLEPTAGLLTRLMGFRFSAAEGSRYRFATGPGGPGSVVDVELRRDLFRGRVAVGTVHHVAWRTAGDETQLGWRSRLLAAGYQVTPVRDRLYFRSIYFLEPGGVLFEIATDPPGFTVDETPEALGTGLRLPPWLEPRRAEIEAALAPVTLPVGPARTT